MQAIAAQVLSRVAEIPIKFYSMAITENANQLTKPDNKPILSPFNLSFEAIFILYT